MTRVLVSSIKVSEGRSMTNKSDAILQQIYDEGVEHDAKTRDRTRCMLNITPETGEFLDSLIMHHRPKRILELGTSNGYSTIWLARAAARFGGKVISLEFLPSKVAMAAKNIGEAELSGSIEIKMLNIGKYLREASTGSFDFVFLDSDRSSYVQWWRDIERVLEFGTLVADNATSHPYEMQPLMDLLYTRPELEHEVRPIGNGQLVVRKATQSQ